MLEEIAEVAVPWGGWAVALAAVGVLFPREARRAVKTAIRAGYGVADRVQEAGHEVVEKGQDLVAEVRAEREQARAAEEPGDGHRAAPRTRDDRRPAAAAARGEAAP